MPENKTVSCHFPRAPLSRLELSATDLIADELRKAGLEPSYEAVARFAPPLKYVGASFKTYPLVLGEKDGATKMRLLADGSELHLGIRYNQRHCGLLPPEEWFGPAFSAQFAVGSGGRAFAGRASWLEGCLPVARIVFEHEGVRYTLKAFGAQLPCTAQRLCAWVAMGVERLKPDARARIRISFKSPSPMRAGDGYLFHPIGKSNALRGGLSSEWAFDAEAQALEWSLPNDRMDGWACLVLADEPALDSLLEEPACDRGSYGIDPRVTLEDSGLWMRDWAQPDRWHRRLASYAEGWKSVLASAAQVELPEARINHAQRNARIGAFTIANRDQMNYSVHNWYERMYGDESAQASIGLAYWGHFQDAARYLNHQAFYTQIDIAAHDLGSRLHWFCRYISLSDDRGFLDLNRSRMERWAQWIVEDVKAGQHGLGRPAGHCGDLHAKQVFSLSANALAWRGLRDFAVLTGHEALLALAAEYREAIRRAAMATLDKDAQPPFMPMCLHGDEKTPNRLRDNLVAAYWALTAPNALYTNALGDAHPCTHAMIETFRRRYGLCAGLVRFGSDQVEHGGLNWEEFGLDDLYGAKLSETFARRDEPDDVVLALYGKLALGLTPDTFVGGEGATLVPTHVHDPECGDGRLMHLPPNSASQMFLPTLLRHALVYDMDSKEDGRYDTLRLAFSTPRAWLCEGQAIRVRGLPTAFGPVSYALRSSIESRRCVEADVNLPERRKPTTGIFLRLRVPAGRSLAAVTVNGEPDHAFDRQTQTIDLSKWEGDVQIRASFE